MSALLKSTLYLIATSVIISSGFAYSQNSPTMIGENIASIMPSTYDAFAKSYETESGAKVSCISAVIYGLRKTGFQCEYNDFKAYFSTLVKQASVFEAGKTKVSKRGLVLFNRTHFVALYRDTNENGVVDIEDEIIHAYFSPLVVTTIGDWLDKDINRPVYYINLDDGIVCPSTDRKFRRLGRASDNPTQ
jgi:hypothetical protein